MLHVKWCQPWDWNMRGEFYFLECEPSLKINWLAHMYVWPQLSYVCTWCLGILVEIAIAPLESITYWISWGAEMLHDFLYLWVQKCCMICCICMYQPVEISKGVLSVSEIKILRVRNKHFLLLLPQVINIVKLCQMSLKSKVTKRLTLNLVSTFHQAFNWTFNLWPDVCQVRMVEVRGGV